MNAKLPSVWPFALAHAVEFGVAVGPLQDQSKIPPAGTNGGNGASSHPEQITEFERLYPRGNYLIAMGGCLRLFGVDFDSAEALAEFGRRFGARPATPTVSTPKPGRHEYYTLPVGVELRNSAGRLSANVDTRGAGGYLVGPGSTLPSGRYACVDGLSFFDVPIAPLPDNILDALQQPAKARATLATFPPATPHTDVTRRVAAYIRTLPALHDGEGRNATAFRLGAFVLYTCQQSLSDAQTALDVWNGRNAQPLSDDRLQVILANAAKYGKAA